jgi:basic amino acid/polyamine antiporter, APA family
MGCRAVTERQAEIPTRTAPGLKRTLSLGHATLYGLGVTIGAGIYVLIGEAAAHSAMYAPAAFAIAALLMAFTAGSFAELVSRAPVAAGEAAYVALAFRSDRLARFVGLFVVGIAVISAATISVGAAGYIAVFVPLPAILLIAAVVLAMGGIAAWGIKESISFVALMTLIEVGGLVVVILAGMLFLPGLFSRLPEMVPPLQTPGIVGSILSTTLLAVFAFIGFESLANVAEEVEDPARTIPWAIFLTLILATLLYMLVVWIALLAVPAPELMRSNAPLALVFERLTGLSPRFMSAVAIVATLNGIVIQIILASRVLYGLGRQGQLPAVFADVNPKTRTPLFATTITAALVLLFALFLPLHDLADLTARLTLLVFAVVNLSLARIKLRGDPPPEGAFVAPTWLPWAGCATCIALLIAELALETSP